MLTQGFLKIATIFVIVIVLITASGFLAYWIVTGQKLPFQESWTYERGLGEALTKNDPSFCERINNRYVHDEFVLIAKEAREDCKATYAVKKEDVAYCMQLSDDQESSGYGARDICLKSLAENLQRPELCEQMPAIEDPNYGQLWLKECKAAAKLELLLEGGGMTIPSSYEQCSIDSDCIYVASYCGSCNCDAVINKNFGQKYKNQFGSLCNDYLYPDKNCDPLSCVNDFDDTARCVNETCHKALRGVTL